MFIATSSCDSTELKQTTKSDIGRFCEKERRQTYPFEK